MQFSWRKSTGEVAQTSKSAVSQVSQPARLDIFDALRMFHARPIWKSAIQQVWKPALQGGVYRLWKSFSKRAAFH
jgi:hypothetical protein